MVRRVREENLPAIKELIRSALLDQQNLQEMEPSAGSTAYMEEYIGNLENHIKNDSLWYYLLDDKEVAVMGVEKDNHISICFTSPAYRRQGAAKEMFEAVKTVLLSRGFLQITAVALPASQDFFRKLGFHTVNCEQQAQPNESIKMIYRF